MLAIKQIDVIDTLLNVAFTLDLTTGEKLNIEVQFKVEFTSTDIILRPTHFGSVIGRNPNKVLALEHCHDLDIAGNTLEMLKALAQQVDLELDYHPDDDDEMAVWNIKRALMPHFHLNGTNMPDEGWIGETLQDMIDQSFPAGVLA